MSDATILTVLAVPARRRLLEVLQAADHPLTAGEAAQAINLHVTTVRFHLDQLEQAGLIEREVHHENRRGRPSVRYVATQKQHGDSRDKMIGALADVAALNPATTRGSSLAAQSPMDAGIRWANGLPAPTEEPQQAVAREFAQMGFEPRISGNAIELHACPFHEAAQRHTDIVCQVHAGLAQGLAASAQGGEAVQVELKPFVQPDLCLLTFQQTRREPLA